MSTTPETRTTAISVTDAYREAAHTTLTYGHSTNTDALRLIESISDPNEADRRAAQCLRLAESWASSAVAYLEVAKELPQ